MKESDELKKESKGKFIVAANAFIFKDNKILITKRSSSRDHDPNKWECVSGRFNQNFGTVEDELLREIRDELGDNFKIRLIAPISFYHFYKGDDPQAEMVGINYICEYISGSIALSEEHTDYKWIKPASLIDFYTDPKLITDVNHLIDVKDIYLSNKAMLQKYFKKSN